MVLARVEAGASESLERDPMRLSDLFDWMQTAVYRELNLKQIPPIERSRRELQQLYLAKLGAVANSSDAGMPSEARALARAELVSLESAAARALRAANVERETRAHLELLRAEASDALTSGKR